MQREQRGRRDFHGYDDPFSSFRELNMFPMLAGDRSIFADPFFSRPFSNIFVPGHLSSDACHADVTYQASGSTGLVIKELNSDDEAEQSVTDNQDSTGTVQRSSTEPSVVHPEDEAMSKNHKINHATGDGNEASSCNAFRSCKITYGGVDGAYYTSSRTRSTGRDGVMVEETKEADVTTGQATHRISRGIYQKGHSVTRKLNPEGNIDTVQTLHNINEDELAGFEKDWSSAKSYLPSSNSLFGHPNTSGVWRDEPGWMTAGRNPFSHRGGQSVRGMRSTAEGTKPKKVVRINVE